MKKNKVKKPKPDAMKPKGKSKYALKGTETDSKKWITLKSTGKRVRVSKSYDSEDTVEAAPEDNQ